MKQTPTSDTPCEAPFNFTDPVEVYYRTIYLRSSKQGGYVDANQGPVSDVEFSNLSKQFPGDIVVDGQIHCDPSAAY